MSSSFCRNVPTKFKVKIFSFLNLVIIIIFAVITIFLERLQLMIWALSDFIMSSIISIQLVQFKNKLTFSKFKLRSNMNHKAWCNRLRHLLWIDSVYKIHLSLWIMKYSGKYGAEWRGMTMQANLSKEEHLDDTNLQHLCPRGESIFDDKNTRCLVC